MAIRVVTDSSSDLPSEMADQLRITIVPLNVHFGTEGLKDGVNLPTDRFYERLMTNREFPKTSQPSVGDFVNTTLRHSMALTQLSRSVTVFPATWPMTHPCHAGTDRHDLL